MKPHHLPARLSSAVFPAALLGLALYMVGLATGDWLARYALAGSRAGEYGERICRALPGCQSVSVQPLFDWHDGRRYLRYQIAGARIDSTVASDTIKRAAGESDGLLGFAVKVPFKVDVGNAPVRHGQ